MREMKRQQHSLAAFWQLIIHDPPSGRHQVESFPSLRKPSRAIPRRRCCPKSRGSPKKSEEPHFGLHTQDSAPPRKASLMAQDHDQKSAKGQKPDLNAIQPGMEVEDTARELGENDVSKPLVIDVIRDKHGQVQYVLISKGLLFKKQVLVSVGRIKEVKLDLEDKKSPGKVVIETSPEDERL